MKGNLSSILMSPKFCDILWKTYIPKTILYPQSRIPDIVFIKNAILSMKPDVNALEVGAWDTDAWREIGPACGHLTVSDSFSWLDREYCKNHMMPPEKWMAEAKAAGVDAKKIDILTMDIKEEYDVIYAISVIEHLEDDIVGLKNIRRALKPGGRFVFTTEVNLYQAMDYQANIYFRVYTPQQIASRLKSAGFEITKVSATVPEDPDFDSLMREAIGKPEMLTQPYRNFCSAGFSIGT